VVVVVSVRALVRARGGAPTRESGQELQARRQRLRSAQWRAQAGGV